MKEKITSFIIILLYSTVAFGQIEVDLRIYDSCNNSVVALDYEITQNDTTIASRKNVAVVRARGAYLVSVAVERNNLWCYQNFHVTIDENHKSDTLYLNKISLCNSGVLHATDNFYYDCDKVADGTLEEIDKNGVVRVKGKFIKGWPKGKLRFFNDKGEIASTEIHRKGKLIKIK